MLNKRFFAVCLLIMTALAVYGVNAQEATPEPMPVERLTVEVISVRPHDINAYTQGLVLHNGIFYESTGNPHDTQSELRHVNPETGEVLLNHMLPYATAPDQYFGEGLALVDDRLIQLTWKDQFAFMYDRDTLELLGLYFYQGQGWGLCYDGEVLYMSDGSPFLYMRDPESFKLLGSIEVLQEGLPLNSINELECVGDVIYANVYGTDNIVRIDKASGNVTAIIDASSLLTQEERDVLPGSSGDHVLNGIAYDPENDVFFLTGKFWDRLFEVRFVPAE